MTNDMTGICHDHNPLVAVGCRPTTDAITFRLVRQNHLGISEERVRAVQVIKDAEDAEALVELEMVEVVRLVGGEEWKVEAGVRVDAVHGDEGAPQPH